MTNTPTIIDLAELAQYWHMKFHDDAELDWQTCDHITCRTIRETIEKARGERERGRR